MIAQLPYPQPGLDKLRNECHEIVRQHKQRDIGWGLVVSAVQSFVVARRNDGPQAQPVNQVVRSSFNDADSSSETSRDAPDLLVAQALTFDELENEALCDRQRLRDGEDVRLRWRQPGPLEDVEIEGHRFCR
ncbi:MAG: hypothetical protein ACR2JB_22915 [Bryobacteraceae bacterium]